MTHANPHAPAYSRLMRLADQVLNALETAPRPTTAMDIARTARAIMAAERMLRAIYTPLVKAKSTPAKEAAMSEMPPPSRRYRADPPPPFATLTREDESTSSPALAGEVAASEAKVTEGAIPTSTSDTGWQKGWADKQAQMREQRAARTGKWPDGTPYRKSG